MSPFVGFSNKNSKLKRKTLTLSWKEGKFRDWIDLEKSSKWIGVNKYNLINILISRVRQFYIKFIKRSDIIQYTYVCVRMQSTSFKGGSEIRIEFIYIYAMMKVAS